jgi:predicted dehydrogenase
MAPPIHLALYGVGSIAEQHIAAIALIPELKIVAIVDRTPAHAADFAQRHQLDAARYQSLDDLLQSPPPQLDAIVLLTPHTLHHQHARQALAAGLHVLVEKPMVTETAHALDLWRTAHQARRQLAIAFQGPASMAFKALADLRRAGNLGQLHSVQGSVSQDWLAGAAGTWRVDPDLSGGGFLYDTGAHLLNAVLWLCDEPIVEAGCLLDRRGTAVDVNAAVTLRFASGAMASLSFAGDAPIQQVQSHLSLTTTAGIFRTDQYGLRFRFKVGRRTGKMSRSSTGLSTVLLYRNFAAAIRGQANLLCPPRYGVLLCNLIDALRESDRTRALAPVNPVPATID